MPLFTTLTQEQMGREIAAAKQRVILAAPGIEKAVATALVEAQRRLPPGAVQVVLDVSATASRLGYGEHAAVEQLAAAGMPLREQPGLRLGLLICDDHGWSYASTARLVEAGPGEHDDACNAIALTGAQVLVLRAELPATSKDDAVPTAPEYPVIGIEPVTQEKLDTVNQALKIAPPLPFDLARQTQVYHSLLQFVELSFEGFSVQNRRVQLPKTLPVIASKDRAVKDRLLTSLKLLDEVENPDVLKDITVRLDELRAAFLIPVGHAGRLILKNKLGDFESELQQIEDDLAQCKQALAKDLAGALDKVIESLVPELARAVKADQPTQFRGRYPDTDAAAQDYVRDQLTKAFPSAASLVQGMKIHKFYKDVTYETLTNKEFVQKVKEQIPESIRKGALLEEYTVAKEAL